jgi:hypothetical protein
MVKNKRTVKRIAKEFLEKSFPALLSEDIDIHKMGEIWIVDVMSRFTGTKKLSIKIDSKSGIIVGIEMPKKLDAVVVKRKVKTCSRCGESFSLPELKITRTSFEGSHKHILVINVSCPKCRRALSPMRIARKELKKSYLEYLEALHLSPEYYKGSRR